MNLRCILDGPRDYAQNIALDEVVFTAENFKPTFRFYTWTQAAYTIGYFQKIAETKNADNLPVIRRMTGGLTVLHDKDLSFSLIASDDIWPYIYEQEKSYKIIHENLRNALAALGIICDGGGNFGLSKNNFSCVDTFYKDDLFLNGKKIAGSCQRRRGKRILIEGSLHLHFDDKMQEKFANIFFDGLAGVLKCTATRENISGAEIEEASKLAAEKYSCEKWSGLF